MSYDAPPDPLDRDLVFEFFWRFSVFECALKREGFLSQDRYENAKPDWHAFAKSISGKFANLSVAKFSEALFRLQENPPRRQVVRNGSLGWSDISREPDESEEACLLKLVQTIRNNLFHGGKYPDGPIEEIERDKALLRAALTVLEACYELHPGLKQWRRAA